MLQPATILTLGFLLGLKHATDADHVVAVTTIVSKQKKLRNAAMVGAAWGIGHTFMIVIVGIAIIIFHLSIPEKLQLFFEFTVAIVLIALGIANLTGIMGAILQKLSGSHRHSHSHESSPGHMHSHAATGEPAHAHHETIAVLGFAPLIRPLIIGVIHGLAGSAAVTLLILGSITDERMAIIYLGIFGLGTVTGMMLITTALGLPIIAGGKKFQRFDRIVTRIAGCMSIAYGIYFGYQVGFVEGLFR